MNQNQNINKFPQPSQQQQPHSQSQQFPPAMNQVQAADMFSSPAMPADALRHPSPHPNDMQQNPGVGQAVQPIQQGLSGPMTGGRTTTDLDNHFNLLRTMISTLEATYNQTVQQLNSIRGTNPAAESQLGLKIKETQAEIIKKRELLKNMAVNWYVRHAIALYNK